MSKKTNKQLLEILQEISKSKSKKIFADRISEEVISEHNEAVDEDNRFPIVDTQVKRDEEALNFLIEKGKDYEIPESNVQENLAAALLIRYFLSPNSEGSQEELNNIDSTQKEIFEAVKKFKKLLDTIHSGYKEYKGSTLESALNDQEIPKWRQNIEKIEEEPSELESEYAQKNNIHSNTPTLTTSDSPSFDDGKTQSTNKTIENSISISQSSDDIRESSDIESKLNGIKDVEKLGKKHKTCSIL